MHVYVERSSSSLPVPLQILCLLLWLCPLLICYHEHVATARNSSGNVAASTSTEQLKGNQLGSQGWSGACTG